MSRPSPEPLKTLWCTDKVPGEHSPRALGRAFPPAPTRTPHPKAAFQGEVLGRGLSREGPVAQRPHERLGAQDGFCAPWMEPGCSRDVDVVRSLKHLLQQSLSGQRQEGGWEAGSLKGPGGVSRTGERLHMEGVELLDEWPIALHEVGWPNATSTKQPP